MQEYKVILTWEAIYDVTDIADYIEARFGISRADKFQRDMQKQLRNLEVLGNAFGKTNVFYRNYCICKKSFPPSIIFYIKGTGNTCFKSVARGTGLGKDSFGAAGLYISLNNFAFELQEG